MFYLCSDTIFLSKCYNLSILSAEAAKTPGRETGGSKGSPHQRVGDQQATGVGTAEPAAERTERPLQPTA